MKTSDFDYDLPESFIAQTPSEPRDASRLLVLHKDKGRIEHRIFHELGDYVRPGDLLVVNRTRVLPARLFGSKPTGGKVEILLLRRADDTSWECLMGGKGLKSGSKVAIESGPQAKIVRELSGAERLVRFSEPIEPHLSKIGHVPLPPYIHEELKDPERYQTMFADRPGSAAAPTAGLHFTPRLLKQLQSKGVRLAEVVLHIGLDTFAPVTEEKVEEHIIHTEWCELSSETAQAVNETKKHGGRVLAVGTTTVRTLESAFSESNNCTTPRIGATSLYIIPGFHFKVVDAMITNFHLPRSTLIMLVSAFAGREQLLSAYEIAKREGYRFYSFGDAMLIL